MGSGMSDGPVIVFRSTDEAVYQPLVAALNAHGIRARAMDAAQAGLRWDVQVISPVEIWVPAADADAAHLYIAEHFLDHPGGAEALGWVGPHGNRTLPPMIYRAVTAGVILLVVAVLVVLFAALRGP